MPCKGFSSCGPQALLPGSRWDLPGPGIEPVSPALASRFLTTGPQGKSHPHFVTATVSSHPTSNLPANPIGSTINMYSESFHFSPLPSRPPSPNPTISSLDHHNRLPPDLPATILAPFSSWSDLAKMKFRLCHTIIQNLPCLPAFPTSFRGKAQALGCPPGPVRSGS